MQDGQGDLRTRQRRSNSRFLGVLVVALSSTSVAAQESQDLAKQLANPIANLMSFPLQINYDEGFGPDGDGQRVLTNFQPVIPIEISDDWLVISRTILPIVWQDDVVPGEGSQFGLGDTVQSLFFSPKKPDASGLVWGIARTSTRLNSVTTAHLG